jgi:GNAT superfamily N-acetyltransferase
MKIYRYEPRPASMADHQVIINLIKEAAGWLHTKGTDQWAKPWPTRSERDRRVADGIAAGETWILWDGSTAVATLTARRAGNPRLWTIVERCDAALYLHRLVVSRDYAGKGIGAAFIDWAANEAAIGHDCRLSRIDVWTTNTALHEYYRQIGFKFLRFADNCEDYPSAALFERPIVRAHQTNAGR